MCAVWKATNHFRVLSHFWFDVRVWFIWRLFGKQASVLWFMWSAFDITIWPNLRKRSAINLVISLTPMFEPDSAPLPSEVLEGNDKTCPAGLVVVSGVLVSWASLSASVAPLIKAIRAQRMFTLTRKITVTTNSCCVRMETRALMSACEHELLVGRRIIIYHLFI